MQQLLVDLYGQLFWNNGKLFGHHAPSSFECGKGADGDQCTSDDTLSNYNDNDSDDGDDDSGGDGGLV